MTRSLVSIRVVVLWVMSLLLPGVGLSSVSELDTAKIEELTGAKGQLNEQEEVFKVSVPRTNLNVTAAGVKMTPPLGLTSWAAFQLFGDHSRLRVMGDLVVLEDQVNPVMDVALENGLQITALHNHFFWDAPKVMFMHIGGEGEVDYLAAAVGKLFAKIQETSGGKGETFQTALDPAKTTLTPKIIEDIFGVQGQLTQSVYKLTIGRTTHMDGSEIGSTMGVNTWAAFVGSDDQAVVDGDVAMFAHEVQAVLKALRRAGINIVALHNHMITESPRVVFLHYWGVGSTHDLATGLKVALDTQGQRPATAFLGMRLGFDIDTGTESRAPDGFSRAVTGSGAKGVWTMQPDPTAPSRASALIQTSMDATSGRFPLYIYDRFMGRDVAVSVKFKPLAGKVDQSAGLVWRYQDPNNYYVVRANALEDNVVLYKVQDGTRTDLKPLGAGPLAYGKKTPVQAEQWQTLQVVARGAHFEVALNGDQLFEVEDDTFTQAGKIGLWTKADSVVAFDDLKLGTYDLLDSAVGKPR